jgi:hypothetical protein
MILATLLLVPKQQPQVMLDLSPSSMRRAVQLHLRVPAPYEAERAVEATLHQFARLADTASPTTTQSRGAEVAHEPHPSFQQMRQPYA